MQAPKRKTAAKAKTLAITPPVFLAVTYGALIVIGSWLLSLPISHVTPVHWFDALFTATSAVTVTGLSVVDIGTVFSPFGQFVVMTLIHLGGVGLMCFAALALRSLGVNVGLTGREFLREDLNQTSIRGLLALARRVILIAILLELIGAVLLATIFVPEFGWGSGLWSAVFHAVSAFNNAGFSLYEHGLEPWVGNLRINLVIPALFIAGGLGYTVVLEVFQKRNWQMLSLHAKLTIAGSLCLIIIGFVLVAALEWNNPQTLGDLETAEAKIMASWFQAVTPRTAGFNTVEIDELSDATVVVIMCLMAIGGGSASTAGGVKVTTFVVLVLATAAFFRGRRQVNAFRRSIPNDEVFKVMAIVTMSLMFVVFGIFLLAATHDHLDFLDLAFEVVSAFATVGLTHGLTSDLDTIGRAVLMAEMFVGRVGPLTLGFMLATRAMPHVRYPEGRVQFG